VIRRANLDGSGVEDLVTTGLFEPNRIALDVAGGKMYWTDNGTDKIQRANLDGSEVEDLVTTGPPIPSTPFALALDFTPGPDIPALSQWGLISMTLLMLSAGTLVLKTSRKPARRRSQAA